MKEKHINLKKTNPSPAEKKADKENPLLNVKTAKPITRYINASDEVKKQKKGQENG